MFPSKQFLILHGTTAVPTRWLYGFPKRRVCRPTPEATIASKARTLMIQAPIQKDAPESASVETWAWGGK